MNKNDIRLKKVGAGVSIFMPNITMPVKKIYITLYQIYCCYGNITNSYIT